MLVWANNIFATLTDMQKTRPPLAKYTILIILTVALLIGIGLLNRQSIRLLIGQLPFTKQLAHKTTTEKQIHQYGTTTRQRLLPMFQSVGLNYPPKKLAFVAIKDRRELQVYAVDKTNKYVFVHNYPILGASGNLGPKLREGDCQVPEGIYKIESLEPNTPYHLGLRVNYPNRIDLERAKQDGRENPGSAILIHGSTGSIGCLAMGDEASEDLFVMAYDAKDRYIPLIICPVDLRTQPPPDLGKSAPSWTSILYKDIKHAMANYPAPFKSR